MEGGCLRFTFCVRSRSLSLVRTPFGGGRECREATHDIADRGKKPQMETSIGKGGVRSASGHGVGREGGREGGRLQQPL